MTQWTGKGMQGRREREQKREGRSGGSDFTHICSRMTDPNLRLVLMFLCCIMHISEH